MTPLFRAARLAATWWNVSKTILQIVLFWSVLLGVVPQAISRMESRWGLPSFEAPYLEAAGWAIFLGSSFVGLWSAWTMASQGHGTPLPLDTARQLVTTGPYGIVRNPMAVAGLGQGAGVGMVLGSWGILLYVAAGGMLWHFAVRPFEERDLATRFGPRFVEYRQRVGLWLPRRGVR